MLCSILENELVVFGHGRYENGKPKRTHLSRSLKELRQGFIRARARTTRKDSPIEETTSMSKPIGMDRGG
jgi:hypothetical protein